MKRQRQRGSNLAFARVSMKLRDSECLWLFQPLFVPTAKRRTLPQSRRKNLMRLDVLRWLMAAQCAPLQESQFQAKADAYRKGSSRGTVRSMCQRPI